MEILNFKEKLTRIKKIDSYVEKNNKMIDINAKAIFRKKFEKKITPIIRTKPENLSKYFSKHCSAIRECNICEETKLVREKGLTIENISIYIRFIRMWGGNQFQYCLGIDLNGFTLCYDRELIPLITRIHKEIFSHISTVAYTLNKSEKKNKKTKKYWNSINSGILALNNAYRKTKFENSRDILTISLPMCNIVMLHGHQLKTFLRGERPEQKPSKKYPNSSIDILVIGHFHKLGVLSVDGFDGLVIMQGSFLYPENVYFPEMLSHMGVCSMKINSQTSTVNFTILRQIIDVHEMKKTIDENVNNPITFENKINFFKKLRGLGCLLPGNHDPFDEIYLKDDIKINNLNSKIIYEMIGYGDYVEFTPSEMNDAKKYVPQILEEIKFKPISKMK